MPNHTSNTARQLSPSLKERGLGGESFDSIRPYNDDEVRGAIDSLLHDRQFSHILKGMVPFLPLAVSRGILRLATVGIHSTLGFQLRFMKPIVKHILRRCSTGYTFTHDGIAPGAERYTFVSNHRDIVLDSAILDVMLHDDRFPTTCEIAIGDNLLIYPWIRTLVRLNKAFIVQRSLPMREMLKASQTMSRYMHYAINEKHENIWIAQREGRAKDSSDQTQTSLLKMLAIDANDTATAIASLKALHIVPLAISYEYDPCDYLKAQEFQLKRDNPEWKKSKQDDLTNMKTGIFGQKGHVHYQTGRPVNEWIDTLAELPEKEFFQALAQRMDYEIHHSYQLYPGNYVAVDLLEGAEGSQESRYTPAEKAAFERYLQERVALAAQGLQAAGVTPDTAFLRERILTMYANPAENKLRVES